MGRWWNRHDARNMIETNKSQVWKEKEKGGSYPIYLLTVSKRIGSSRLYIPHNHLRSVRFELSERIRRSKRGIEKENGDNRYVFHEHWINRLYALASISTLLPFEESKILSWNAWSAIWPPPIATRLTRNSLSFSIIFSLSRRPTFLLSLSLIV